MSVESMKQIIQHNSFIIIIEIICFSNFFHYLSRFIFSQFKIKNFSCEFHKKREKRRTSDRSECGLNFFFIFGTICDSLVFTNLSATLGDNEIQNLHQLIASVAPAQHTNHQIARKSH